MRIAGLPRRLPPGDFAQNPLRTSTTVSCRVRTRPDTLSVEYRAEARFSTHLEVGFHKISTSRADGAPCGFVESTPRSQH